MKRNSLLFLILMIPLVFPGGKAFLFSEGDPIPRQGGRKKESGVTGYLTRSPREFPYWMTMAKQYLGRKEYEQAIIALRKAVRLRPMAEEARFLLGHSYELRGREGLPGNLTAWDYLAEKEYLMAIGIADYLPARYNLAMLYERLERYEEARVELEHIMTISPGSHLGKLAARALEGNFDIDLIPRTFTTKLPGKPQ